MNKTVNMVTTALLIALAIVIPTMFTFARVVLPPSFTATLAAHVPIFISMFISPWSAIAVAVGSAIGFFLTGLPIVVVARAASHIGFALAGAYMIRRNSGMANIIITGCVTAVIHAFLEAVTVYCFADPVPYVTGVGTLIHHFIDYAIAIALVFALRKTKVIL